MTIKYLSSLPKVETNRIKNEVNFSDEEQKIYDLLLKDRSITEISIALKVSTRTVSRRIERIKEKVDFLYVFENEK